MANIVYTNTTIHSEGTLKSTDRTLDFAISGSGFFAVQSANGIIYTRNGSFNLDDQGYLVIKGLGRVMGQNGPIQLGTDAITADGQGNIAVNGNNINKIAVYDFADYKSLSAIGNGTYSGTNAVLAANPAVNWKTLEGSNVNSAEEMTNAIAAQRNLQTCSEALKMYDKILEEASTEVGKVF
jgi:flagellar basal-body rod protein FlgG